MKEENNLEKKVAYWDVQVLDQGHYGFILCSNCSYTPQQEDAYDKCSGCGYEMQGIKPSYQSSGSDF